MICCSCSLVLKVTDQSWTLRVLSSPAVFASSCPQSAPCQRVEVRRVTQRPGGHGEPFAGGRSAQAAHRSVQTALTQARRLEGSPCVGHCRVRQRIFIFIFILRLCKKTKTKNISFWRPNLWLVRRPRQSRSWRPAPSLCSHHNLLLGTERWAPHRTRRPTWWERRCLEREKGREA